jgi:hypothetical protein
VWFAVNDSRPWWLWPNVLALDAPAVAVSWQVFLASVAGVAVPLAASAVLALVVWAVYLVDRGLDASCGADGSDRHRAAGRNPVAWIVTSAVAIFSATVLALTTLPRSYLHVGFAIAAVTVGYFSAVHVVRAKRILDRGMKELSVGVVFALGVALPLIAEAEPVADWLPGVVAFAGLCWLNCLLISVWEDGPVAGPPVWVAVVAGSVAVGAAFRAQLPIAVAVLASTAGLALLYAARGHLSVRVLRVLADAVLLSPLLVAVCQ